MNEAGILQIISQKLSVLISLGLARDGKKISVSDGIAALAPFGLSNAELASILGTKKETVEQLKSRLKSRSGK